jgi:hypothetical protein
MGERTIRRLLIIGASAVVRQAARWKDLGWSECSRASRVCS